MHFRFSSNLKEISDFLYRPENLNNEKISYLNFTSGSGIFEDRKDGSQICVVFSEEGSVSEIWFKLSGGDNTIQKWVEHFQDELGATINSCG